MAVATSSESEDEIYIQASQQYEASFEPVATYSESKDKIYIQASQQYEASQSVGAAKLSSLQDDDEMECWDCLPHKKMMIYTCACFVVMPITFL